MRLTVNGLLVNPVLGTARLEKSREEAAAALTATIWTAPADTYFQKPSLSVGDVVRLTDDGGAERFLGSIHCLERSPEKVTLTAFDRGVYLSRNEVYGVFGFPYHVELSTRPENSIGTDEMWEMATNGLRGALDDLGVNYVVN